MLALYIGREDLKYFIEVRPLKGCAIILIEHVLLSDVVNSTTLPPLTIKIPVFNYFPWLNIKKYKGNLKIYVCVVVGGAVWPGEDQSQRWWDSSPPVMKGVKSHHDSLGGEGHLYWAEGFTALGVVRFELGYNSCWYCKQTHRGFICKWTETHVFRRMGIYVLVWVGTSWASSVWTGHWSYIN